MIGREQREDSGDKTAVSRRRLQSRLQRNLALLVIVAGALILGVLFAGSSRRVSALCHALILGRTDQTEVELEGFFTPVASALRMSRRWAEEGRLDPREPAELAGFFVPLLESWPQVSSMMVASPSGAEFMLLRSGEAWRTRALDPAAHGKLSYNRRWIRGGEAEEWTEELDYDATDRPWFTGAVVARDAATNAGVHWTEPYAFFTTKEPGVTASVATGSLGNPATLVIAFDVLLTDISAFTTQLEVGLSGFVTILTPDKCALGLPRDPRFQTTGARRAAALTPAAELGLPALTRGLACWEELERREDEIFSYTVDGATYWAGLRPVVRDGALLAWIGVFVPESDLIGSAHVEQAAVLAILLAALSIAVVLSSLHGRRVREEVAQAVARAQRLGQYTLIRKIGAGGMGTVYMARHAMLRRPTAIKLLNREGDPEALARFEREVQATASLTNPNTISIYDYGRTPENVFYYAMEYLAGIDLKHLVERYGPLPAGRAIDILAQICASLQEAHEHGLIHRDVKPANIIVSCYGGVPDFVKVLDFGLVKRIDDGDAQEADTDAGSLTRSTVITGTPHFLAPEAITGGGSVDARADLYALGAVAYFLVTGVHVFSGKSAMMLLTQHVGEPPEHPSARLAGGVPEDLERVILGCLAKSPEDRPQSANDLRERLLACASARTWTKDDAGRWWDEHGQEVTEAQSPEAPGSAALLTVDLESRARER